MQAWLVLLLAVLYGGGLAAVQVGLGPKIVENKRQETLRAIPVLFPNLPAPRAIEREVELKEGSIGVVLEIRSSSDELAGWLIPASGQGFADKIELLVGLEADRDHLTGIYVIDQKETPGLGDFIQGQDFRGRFSGKPTGVPLRVVKNGADSPEEIDAITGATISSESVVEIVNRTVESFAPPAPKEESQ
jgi:electron transport complex protein RnfG